jgi:hypothetical protein
VFDGYTSNKLRSNNARTGEDTDMASDATETTKTVNADTRATARKAAATKRSTTAKKGAATRANKRTSAATKRTTTRAKAQTRATTRTVESKTQTAAQDSQRTIDRVGDVAERAARTSVGVVLTARDNVEKAVAELRSNYSTATKREARLKKFERRGSTARKSLERDVKKARTRVERELKARRNSVGKVVNTTPPAPDALVRNARAQADLAAARVGNAVETAQLAGATVVAKVSERVASLA